MPASYMSKSVEMYATDVYEKNQLLENCTAFIEGTVVGIAPPGCHNLSQHVVYIGHKYMHATEFQELTKPDVLRVHLRGPEVGQHHDIFLYLQSGLDDVLAQIMVVDGKYYIVYGYSGYIWRIFLEVQLAGANLSPVQNAFNKAMTKVRISAEW